jgi:hypothetical protein
MTSCLPMQGASAALQPAPVPDPPPSTCAQIDFNKNDPHNFDDKIL